MTNKKKPSLKKALANIDNLPASLFGKIQVDLSSLPCLNKVVKEKITANFDSDVLAAIREVANQHDVAYTTLMNDVLRKIFIEQKNAG
jgi:uncharacterized protein (DUF4415 family)